MGARANRAARRARDPRASRAGNDVDWRVEKDESFGSAGRAGVANDVAGARRTIVAVDLIILGDADAHRSSGAKQTMSGSAGSATSANATFSPVTVRWPPGAGFATVRPTRQRTRTTRTRHRLTPRPMLKRCHSRASSTLALHRAPVCTIEGPVILDYWTDFARSCGPFTPTNITGRLISLMFL